MQMNKTDQNDAERYDAGGRTFDKAGYIEAYCTSGKVLFLQQRIAHLTVKMIDSVAVATLSIHDELRIENRMVSGHHRFLCVFSQTSGRWLWTAGQTVEQRRSV